MKMLSHQWSMETMRRQTDIITGAVSPSLVLANGVYLNTYIKKWEKSNVWIDQDRIIYVGDRLPNNLENTKVVDCSNRYLVPGYIEPHVHPTQLYNPMSMAEHSAKHGTTTLICDNAIFYFLLDDESSFQMMEELNRTPIQFFWWCRYDPQTAVKDNPFNQKRISKWLSHPLVIQGGELTDWPDVLLQGNDEILKWMQETKAQGLKIEGHLPGASERTLTQMRLLGVTCDHEAMTGDEALTRLRTGLATSLRYSSIRPDLPDILEDLLEKGIEHFDRLFMTTDGATPNFLKQGVMDKLIDIAIEKGVNSADAYRMASSNIASYYNMDDCLGHIAPGRLANINILESKVNPYPISVLSKGVWIKKESDMINDLFSDQTWSESLRPLNMNLTLTEKNLEVTSPLGMDMVNAVIAKPLELDSIPTDTDLAEGLLYLSLVDRKGKWITNTIVKGFATDIHGFASSFSCAGDIVLIGKNKKDMLIAFERMKKRGGGLVLSENGSILYDIPLPYLGMMSEHSMEELADEDQVMANLLRERGYSFVDPYFSLLFICSTHLPYIRVTSLGLYDVLKRQVMVPSREIAQD
nr:adenine deaminase C-terminal domain-containing protein [Terrilactibacillus laevilacticus]